MLNYSINDKGVLSIYYDNYIIAELPECSNLTEEEITKLINEVYKESEFYGNRK